MKSFQKLSISGADVLTKLQMKEIVGGNYNEPVGCKTECVNLNQECGGPNTICEVDICAADQKEYYACVTQLL